MSGLAGARPVRPANGLDLVRLILAGTVLVSHSWNLGGFGPEPELGGVSLGQWAVGGFFAISGYLVAGSRSRTRIGPYLKRRAARIYPGYWASLLVVSGLLAPTAALLSGVPLQPRAALDFALNNATLLVRQWTIGDSLQAAAGTELWNGSLWTLSYEFGAYLLLAAVIVSPVYKRWPVTTALLLHVLFALPASRVPAELNAFWLGGFFTAGLVWFALGPRLRVSKGLVAVMLGALVLLTLTHEFRGFGGLPLAYLVLAAGTALPGPRWSADYSYGTYLYAYPVAQVLGLSGLAHLGPVLFVLAVAVTTVPFATASWHCVERPAMMLAEWLFPPAGRHGRVASKGAVAVRNRPSSAVT